MPDHIVPKNAGELRGVIADAAAKGQKLNITAGASKKQWGSVSNSDLDVDLISLSGVDLYEPEELVMSAAAGTSLREINLTLAQRNQRLAFEPPDLGPLWGEPAEKSTIGGVIACNLSGPRRLAIGAARDHLLGFKAINGRGELFKSGGRVMKNVTGFDLCKVMAGAFGTLGVMTHLSFKVLPSSEESRTLSVPIARTEDAVRALGKCLQLPMEISGAAYIPACLSAEGEGKALLRIEGTAASVAYRAEILAKALAEYGATEILETGVSKETWKQVRDVSYFAHEIGNQLWRISVPPTQAARTADQLADQLDGRFFLDWGGGQIWLEIPPREDGAHGIVRSAIASSGGHATLMRAESPIRANVPVFQPQNPVMQALSARLKDAFDPHGILNPGRRGEGA